MQINFTKKSLVIELLNHGKQATDHPTFDYTRIDHVVAENTTLF